MKPWYASRTIILNVVTFVAAIAATLQTEFIETHPEWVGVAGAVVAAANFVLRFLTKVPVQ